MDRQGHKSSCKQLWLMIWVNNNDISKLDKNFKKSFNEESDKG